MRREEGERLRYCDVRSSNRSRWSGTACMIGKDAWLATVQKHLIWLRSATIVVIVWSGIRGVFVSCKLFFQFIFHFMSCIFRSVWYVVKVFPHLWFGAFDDRYIGHFSMLRMIRWWWQIYEFFACLVSDGVTAVFFLGGGGWLILNERQRIGTSRSARLVSVGSLIF